MWKRLKQIAGVWGIIGAIVGVFTLGAGATYNLFMAFEPKGESNGQAAAVHRRVDELSARLDRFTSWAREQIGTIVGRQDRAVEQTAAEYRAINQRLDQQNMLMVEVLKTVKGQQDQTAAEPEGDDGWSLIGTARAARIKAVKKN